MDSRQILSRLFTLGALVLAGISCIRDDTDNRIPDVPDGKVRLTLYTNSADYAAPGTRAAADEDGIDLPVVLVFEGHGNTASFTEAAQAEVSGTETVVTLSMTDQPSTILLVANVPGDKFRNSGTDTQFSAYDITQAMEGKTLDDVKDVLRTQLLNSSLQAVAPFTAPQTKLPLAGIKEVTKIDDTTELGTSSDKLLLTRSVAKATVNVDSGLTGFTLEGAGLVNAPRNGSFYRPAGTAVQDNTSNTTSYLTATTGDGVSGMAPATGNTTADTPLYIYEAADDLGTAVIIKAVYIDKSYYYKLGFVIDEVYREIERNKNYTFTITAAGRGYASMQEAIDAPLSNIEYEIEVTDAYAHEIVSNGQYYLGLSNSEVVLYGSPGTTLSEAFIITTDATAAMGITTATVLSSTTGIYPIPTTINLAETSGGVTTVSVMISTGATGGTITVTLGNLEQEVTVSVVDRLDSSGYLELDGDYVECQITSRGTDNYLAVSPDGTSRIEDRITLTSPGKLYLMAEPYILERDQTGTYRTGGELYAVRKNQDGTLSRIKMYVGQNYVNVGDLPDYATPYMYVGAFWRAEQSGERLIHIPNFTNTVAAGWTARVVDGEDWIMLDTEPTKDPGVTWAAGESPADMNDPANDALYRLTSGSNAISGVYNSTEPLYFRIGLTGPYTPTDEAPARYGKILVNYNDGKNAGMIYVRQGHDPDYLMRSEDPVPNGAIAARTHTVKISPYNITSQEYLDGTKPGGTATSDHSQLALNGGTFTEYPSQVGAYFQWANASFPRYAWHPTNPGVGTAITGWQNTRATGNWEDSYDLKSTHETCPPGYRRATDGSTSVEIANNTPVDDFEQRQSLWLNLVVGVNNNIQNSFWGYLADGFFDRHMITGTITGEADAAVLSDKYNVGYIGRLFYNPYNNASLFFPIAGFRNTTGQISGTAYYGQYWTATSYTGGAMAWSILTRKDECQTSFGNKPLAYPIRCVVDE